MDFSKGQLVIHKSKGWRGWIAGAGHGRSRARWQNPQVLYVDWLQRKPATSACAPSEIIPQSDIAHFSK